MIQCDKSIGKESRCSDSGEALIELAQGRIGQGLSPRPDIYRIKFRKRIDWWDFPVWDRPVDPEIFDHCCHEG